MSAIINEDPPEAPDAGALGPVITALLRREPADRPDASAAARMITDVLSLLTDRTPDAPPGYVPTSVSASPRSVSPGAGGAGGPGPAGAAALAEGAGAAGLAGAAGAAGLAAPAAGSGVQASAEQTAPTTPQPVLGDPARYAQPGRRERPPPDFSSWYGPPPQSGGAPSPGSGSAYPPPAGYGPAAQGPPAPAPWSGAAYAPSRRRRSGLGWKAAVAVLALIGAAAGAATVVLLHQNHSGSPQGPATGTGSAPGTTTGSSGGTLPPPTLQIIDAINQRATGPLPSGFAMTSRPAAAGETAGFSIAAPASWQKSVSGHQTYLRDPADPNTNILIDLTPHTYPDMLQEAQYIEAQSAPRFPGYHRVGMAALTIRGTPGAWWKFTWNNKGVPQEALDLLFVARTPAGPQSYALYMTAPVSKFDQTRPIFDEEAETFATQPA
jgi:hypothetical protein